MTVALLPMTVALMMQVSVGVRVGGDSAEKAKRAERRAAAEMMSDDDTPRRAKKPGRRLPAPAAPPERRAGAFRAPAARSLLLRARAARLRQDSALVSYDATTYQRMSVGLGVRAFGRERLAIPPRAAAR